MAETTPKSRQKSGSSSKRGSSGKRGSSSGGSSGTRATSSRGGSSTNGASARSPDGFEQQAHGVEPGLIGRGAVVGRCT